MKERISKEEAIKIFSSPKKTEKLLDKTLSKVDYEYLLKAEEKGLYSISNVKDDNEICKSDDALKCFMGLLYFEFGVGKDNLPSWAIHSNFNTENWESISNQIPSTCDFTSLNTALDKGATLHCTNSTHNNSNNFTLTNPFNENYANEILVNEYSFSNALTQVNSLSNLILNSLEQGQ